MDLTFGNMLSGEKLLPFYFVLCRASNVGTFMYLIGTQRTINR